MSQVKSKKLSVHYLYVAVFTAVTAFLWVGFEVFRALTTPADIPGVTEEELVPLEENLDQQGLQVVRGRQLIPQNVLDQVVGSPTLVIPEETPEPAVNQATESATIQTQTQEEATPSGSATN